MGGPLAYATDSRYNCADGLICWCLWDFSDIEFIIKETNTKRLTYQVVPLLRLSSSLFGKYKIKTYHLISYDALTDCMELNNLLKSDPLAGTLISLRGAVSLVIQSKPDLKYKDYIKPVLVCQSEQDRMTPDNYTKNTFKRLKSLKKSIAALMELISRQIISHMLNGLIVLKDF